jgi:hypothetical protein
MLGALAQQGMVCEYALTAEVNAIACALDIPGLVYLQFPVSCQVHHCQLGHDAEEHFVLVKDEDIVHESVIMAKSFLAKSIESFVK